MIEKETRDIYRPRLREPRREGAVDVLDAETGGGIGRGYVELVGYTDTGPTPSSHGSLLD